MLYSSFHFYLELGLVQKVFVQVDYDDDRAAMCNGFIQIFVYYGTVHFFHKFGVCQVLFVCFVLFSLAHLFYLLSVGYFCLKHLLLSVINVNFRIKFAYFFLCAYLFFVQLCSSVLLFWVDIVIFLTCLDLDG